MNKYLDERVKDNDFNKILKESYKACKTQVDDEFTQVEKKWSSHNITKENCNFKITSVTTCAAVNAFIVKKVYNLMRKKLFNHIILNYIELPNFSVDWHRRLQKRKRFLSKLSQKWRSYAEICEKYETYNVKHTMPGKNMKKVEIELFNLSIFNKKVSVCAV